MSLERDKGIVILLAGNLKIRRMKGKGGGHSLRSATKSSEAVRRKSGRDRG
ncbi:hypothetical protein MFUM_360001 [Methylacidiphilum fumariolicum SolV]|uniref:Uncharacterized protein n=1 Tax=Methylacidiphilum fumariolicum (strain SolV) TaxID=1156937 RepID=I0JY14_METFB|nr:hypothetical protein MFUM_360001 [Methylacidiphilum fumariolicum SolV]